MDEVKGALKRTVNEMLSEEFMTIRERYNFSDSESDEVDEVENKMMIPLQNLEVRTKKICRVQNYINIVPMYDEGTFQSHFRMSRRTIQKLIDCFNEKNYQSVHKAGKLQISTEKAVLMTVWYMSNTETFRQISDRFDVSFSSAHKTIDNVLSVLVGMKDNIITWPTTPGELRKINRDFQKKQGLKGCIGAVDGCHIKINRPIIDEECYVNRKGFHSLLLQGIALPNKLFSNAYCGEPGSMHDARLLRKSPLYKEAIDNPGFFGDNYLVGDSAYPNLKWLIAPFKDNGNLNRRHKEFNFKHSSTRMVIEHAFGLLKGRFRRLLHLTNLDIEFCVKIVMAGCILHNICINSKDDTIVTLHKEDDDEEEFPAENNNPIEHESESRRERLMNDICP